MNNNLIADALKSVFYYLNRKEKYYSVYIFFLLIFSSILDVFGLATLVPVIMASSTPGEITKNKYFGVIYRGLNFTDEKTFLIYLILSVFIFFLFKNLFTTWIGYKQVKFTAKVALTIINKQFDKYTNLPFWHFNDEGSAKLINSIVHIPAHFVTGIIRPIFIFFSEVIIILIIVIGILIYQPLLFAILVLVLVPSGIFLYFILKNRSERIGNKLNELRPVSQNVLTDTFNGFVEIKLANEVSSFKRRFITYQKEVQELEAQAYLISTIPVKVIEMVAILGVVTIFLYSIFFPGNGGNLVAIIGLFAAASYRLMPSVNRLLNALINIKQYNFAIKNLKSYQEFEKGNLVKSDLPSISFNDSIIFKDLTFSFPGSVIPTISNLNLTIKKGEKIGFIGVSGSGKTTLMNILLRFYEEQQGSILVDGLPLESYNKHLWYQLIGYVKQDTFLMEASIQDNITLKSNKVDLKLLDYAIEQASLKNLIDSLPNGINSVIGEKGSKLSGGQRQRIGIARALYKNAQILILDEATSALDNKTEREVSEAISKLSGTNITIFIIAHRITTLRDCNRIFEMKGGKIIAERSYEDIVKETI